MNLARARERAGLAQRAPHERWGTLLTAYASPHVDSYLENALPADRQEFYTVMNELKRALGTRSAATCGSGAQSDDSDEFVARVEREIVTAKPAVVGSRALAHPTRSAKRHAQRSCSGSPDDQHQSASGLRLARDGGAQVSSNYVFDFQDWTSRGMASKVHRDHALDWGSNEPAPFASLTREPADKALHQTYYRSVYNATISDGGAATTAKRGLDGLAAVRFYAADLVRAPLHAALADWYGAQSEASQVRFKDVMRRLDAHLKRTTTAKHDWRTVATGSRSRISLSKHAYDSSASLVNASSGRTKTKLRADIRADEDARLASDEVGNDAVRARVAAESGAGTDWRRPTIDARRGTSLLSQASGLPDAPPVMTTYSLAFPPVSETAAAAVPVTRGTGRDAHHLPSRIPDMPIGLAASRDSQTSTYAATFVSKAAAAAKYRGGAVRETSQWNKKTSL